MVSPALHKERITFHIIWYLNYGQQPPPIPTRECDMTDDYVLGTHEAELRRLDPGEDAIDTSVTRLAEIRHLHHGVFAQGANRSMMDRYDALRALESSQMNAQFVCDIAAIWWSAVIIDPQRLCKPSVAPWEIQPCTE
jgi:hypothetical protein